MELHEESGSIGRAPSKTRRLSGQFGWLWLALLAALISCQTPDKSQPTNAHAHAEAAIDLGRTQFEQGQYARAKKSFLKAVSPELPATTRGTAFLGIARCDLAIGQVDDALPLLQRSETILKGNPLHSRVLVALGETYIDLDSLGLAREYLLKAYRSTEAGPVREHVAYLLSLLYEGAMNAKETRRFRREAPSVRRSDYIAWREKILGPEIPLETPPSRSPRRVASFTFRSRAEWGAHKTKPNANAMTTVNALTIHHSGEENPVPLANPSEVRAHLLKLQHYSQRRQGWADIGYHFLIDPRGDIWEGRSLIYQGAHAGNSRLNKGNIGIALLGNFDRERPTPAQVEALRRLSKTLVDRYRVRPSRVFSHKEQRRIGGLAETQCPGRHLEPEIPRLRSWLRGS